MYNFLQQEWSTHYHSWQNRIPTNAGPSPCDSYSFCRTIARWNYHSIPQIFNWSECGSPTSPIIWKFDDSPKLVKNWKRNFLRNSISDFEKTIDANFSWIGSGTLHYFTITIHRSAFTRGDSLNSTSQDSRLPRLLPGSSSMSCSDPNPDCSALLRSSSVWTLIIEEKKITPSFHCRNIVGRRDRLTFILCIRARCNCKLRFISTSLPAPAIYKYFRLINNNCYLTFAKSWI